MEWFIWQNKAVCKIKTRKSKMEVVCLFLVLVFLTKGDNFRTSVVGEFMVCLWKYMFAISVILKHFTSSCYLQEDKSVTSFDCGILCAFVSL